MLRYLDPAGDLILNGRQAAAALEDLRLLVPKTQGQLRAIFEEIAQLLEQAAAEPHLYVCFVGD